MNQNWINNNERDRRRIEMKLNGNWIKLLEVKRLKCKWA